MLFYPFEEQLNFPAISIEQSNLLGLKFRVVGYKLWGKKMLAGRKHICPNSWIFAFSKAKTHIFILNRHAIKKRYDLDVFKISKNDI
jgi:hypothetical protein